MVSIKKIVGAYARSFTRASVIGEYHPSGLCGCSRKYYLRFFNPKSFGLHTLQVFLAGNAIHSYFHNVLSGSRLVSSVEAEVPLESLHDGFKIVGHVDFVLDRKVVVELKSTRSLSYVIKGNRPKPAHIDQLLLYMGALRLSEGKVVYIQKNDFEVATFKVKFSQKRYNQLIERAVELHKCLVEKRLPEKTADTWQCSKKWCLYYDECKEAGG